MDTKKHNGGLPPINQYRYLTSRPLDFVYDTTFTVSDQREYYETVRESLKMSTLYELQPIFSSMFSDVPRYPRLQLLLKSANPIPDYIDASFMGKMRATAMNPPKTNIIKGVDRFKYFQKPMMKIPTAPSFQENFISDFDTYSDTLGYEQQKVDKVQHQKFTFKAFASLAEKKETKFTQTIYRESETQTVPWAPPYVVSSTVTPEILTLTNLSWGQGLPAGVHEVEIIERARIIRAWNKLIPNVDTPEIEEKKYKCLSDIERNEWMFREQEIQMIHSLRIEIAQDLISKTKKLHKKRRQDRIDRVTAAKEAEVEQKIKYVREKKERELRKLYQQHKKVRKKFTKLSALEEITDPTSQLNGPMLIYGESSKPRHEIIDFNMNVFSDLDVIKKVEEFKLPNKSFDNIKRLSKPKSFVGMCPRVVRWSEEHVEKLQKEIMKDYLGSQEFKEANSIIEKLSFPKPPPPIMETLASDKELEVNKAATYIQKTLRGRATQFLMFQNINHFKHLIEELKSTHAFQKYDMEELTERRYLTLTSSRKNEVIKLMEARKKQVLNSLRDKGVCDTLTFLSHVQERLEDDERVHAFAMLAERERWRREAAESGRRQREEIFRRKQDEAFKQVMKIRQETVDIFLEDILIRSMNWLAEDKAREHVRQVAQKIDLAAKEADARDDMIEQEEIIAHLLHNFVVPEAHKEVVRRKLEQKQRRYLEMANKIVTENLLSKDPTTALAAPAVKLQTSVKSIYEKKKSKPKTIEVECAKEKLFMIAPSESESESNLQQPVKDTALFSIKFTRDIIKNALQSASESAKETAEILLQDIVQTTLESSERETESSSIIDEIITRVIEKAQINN
ncbi:cilia- and flagella-associated protein 91-like [Lycorma delicatula]|uniref:cilia- and flagella-associated protein 91-like n=1 Tax=Lycorma delicatula TaxID=130591 RepID=UPI003F5198F0